MIWRPTPSGTFDVIICDIGPYNANFEIATTAELLENFARIIVADVKITPTELRRRRGILLGTFLRRDQEAGPSQVLTSRLQLRRARWKHCQTFTFHGIRKTVARRYDAASPNIPVFLFIRHVSRTAWSGLCATSTPLWVAFQ